MDIMKGSQKPRNYTRRGRGEDDRSHASPDLHRVPNGRSRHANVSDTRHVNASRVRNSNGRCEPTIAEAGWLRGGGEPEEFQSGGAIMSKLSSNTPSYGWDERTCGVKRSQGHLARRFHADSSLHGGLRIGGSLIFAII